MYGEPVTKTKLNNTCFFFQAPRRPRGPRGIPGTPGSVKDMCTWLPNTVLKCVAFLSRTSLRISNAKGVTSPNGFLEVIKSSTATPLGCNEKENNREEESADVWTDIAAAMNQWAQRILDAETRHSRTISFRENIEASLQRQQLDGFLNHNDMAELSCIADL